MERNEPRRMKILIPIKQVPETNAVRMDEATGTMIREGVDAIVNPFDLYALELGLRLREIVVRRAPAEALASRVRRRGFHPAAAENAIAEAPRIVCLGRGIKKGENVGLGRRLAGALDAALGGTLSGEHGIGHKRLAWMHLFCSPAHLEMMRTIKLALDPHLILNPGKIVPAPGH